MLPGDAARLGQALANLVDNALRYGPGTVELAARDRDGTVELHVTDEGAGFDAEFLPHAFERFSRHDEARGRGGPGSDSRSSMRSRADTVGARTPRTVTAAGPMCGSRSPSG